MAITESTTKFAPAYVSFPAFVSFLDRLAEGLPHAIDRSIMTTMSGATQGHLLTSLKFLGLIEDDCIVTGGLKSLIDSKLNGEATFKEAMKDLSKSAYASVLGDVEILRMTPRQLADRFREAGADGSTLVKAIRFYLNVLDASGVSYPKHFSQAARNATPNGKKPEVRRTKVENSAEEEQKPQAVVGKPQDSGMDSTQQLIRIPIPTVGNPLRVASVPPDLNEADCKYLAVMIEAIANRLAASRPLSSTP